MKTFQLSLESSGLLLDCCIFGIIIYFPFRMKSGVELSSFISVDFSILFPLCFSRYIATWVLQSGSKLYSYFVVAAAAAKSLQSCPTLCDPVDGSPPGSPVPGILQARTLELVAISFSNAWKWKVKGKSLSCVWLLATPWTAAYQAPPSMGFSRQEYWSGVPLPSAATLLAYYN